MCRTIGTAELPVAEMPGDKDDPATEAHRVLDDVPPGDLWDELEDLRRGQRWKQGSLDRGAAEVGVGCPRDSQDLLVGQLGERCAQLRLDHRPANAERSKAERADRRTQLAGPQPRQCVHRAHRSAEREVFRGMRERLLPDAPLHLVAHRCHSSRSRAAAAARSNASIIADSGNSRATRARPALPIAMRCASWPKKEAIAAAVAGGSDAGSRMPVIPSAMYRCDNAVRSTSTGTRSAMRSSSANPAVSPFAMTQPTSAARNTL